MFRQLAVQIGIALEQANLLHELQQAQEVLRLRDLALFQGTGKMPIPQEYIVVLT
ncbi:hypothetical protein [Scytonema sp. NUACC26]|uniref:hypothetical protein n=1 Tax=Scytonema sp. NUACC26 TaxID=3140176 RepID=UPI0038B2433E